MYFSFVKVMDFIIYHLENMTETYVRHINLGHIMLNFLRIHCNVVYSFFIQMKNIFIFPIFFFQGLNDLYLYLRNVSLK